MKYQLLLLNFSLKGILRTLLLISILRGRSFRNRGRGLTVTTVWASGGDSLTPSGLWFFLKFFKNFSSKWAIRSWGAHRFILDNVTAWTSRFENNVRQHFFSLILQRFKILIGIESRSLRKEIRFVRDQSGKFLKSWFFLPRIGRLHLHFQNRSYRCDFYWDPEFLWSLPNFPFAFDYFHESFFSFHTDEIFPCLKNRSWEVLSPLIIVTFSLGQKECHY